MKKIVDAKEQCDCKSGNPEAGELTFQGKRERWTQPFMSSENKEKMRLLTGAGIPHVMGRSLSVCWVIIFTLPSLSAWHPRRLILMDCRREEKGPGLFLWASQWASSQGNSGSPLVKICSTAAPGGFCCIKSSTMTLLWHADLWGLIVVKNTIVTIKYFF